MSRPVYTSRDVKKSNRAHLLNLLYFNEPTTRLDLSRDSGLSPATVTKIIAEMIEEGIVIETGLEDSQGGRPRTTLNIDPEYGYFIGVDVGETHVYVELFDIKLRTLRDIRYALTSNEILPEEIARLIIDAVRTIQHDARIPDEKIIGIGVGVPGVVEREGGVSIFAPNWGWHNVGLLDLLRDALRIPILLDNGAQAMALAEMWFGAGRGCNNMVVLLIGTGIGSGVIAEGKLYRGTSNSAGEWGHTCIELDGRACRCGSHGCIEAYAGAPGIIEQLQERDPNNPILRAGSQVETIRALNTAAQNGDPLALAVLSRVSHTLGAGIANLINLFNPELIVIGGWAGKLLSDTILPGVESSVRRYALSQPLSVVKLKVSELGWDGVSLGAANLALHVFLMGDDPIMVTQ